jgi:hypothetical protein
MAAGEATFAWRAFALLTVVIRNGDANQIIA